MTNQAQPKSTGRHVAPQTRANALAEADGRYRAGIAAVHAARAAGEDAQLVALTSNAVRHQLQADVDAANRIPDEEG